MTDTIQHHLTDDILMAYSAGSLPEAFNLLVASHVSLCDQCRAQVESFDALGGALLADAVTEPVTVDDASLAATLAMIAAPRPQQARLRPRKASILPGPLQDYVGGDLEAVRWRPIGMGVRQAVLSTSKDATARLLLIPAGAAMPDHGHKGTEITMVLKGAFVDEDGYFQRGDVEIADQSLQHTPVADVGEDCVCLAVTDAPLKFRAFLPKIAQRFIRI